MKLQLNPHRQPKVLISAFYSQIPLDLYINEKLCFLYNKMHKLEGQECLQAAPGLDERPSGSGEGGDKAGGDEVEFGTDQAGIGGPDTRAVEAEAATAGEPWISAEMGLQRDLPARTEECEDRRVFLWGVERSLYVDIRVEITQSRGRYLGWRLVSKAALFGRQM